MLIKISTKFKLRLAFATVAGALVFVAPNAVFAVGNAITCPGGAAPIDGQCINAQNTGTPAADTTTQNTLGGPLNTGPQGEKKGKCGAGEQVVETSFDFGCKGQEYCAGKADCSLNPIYDMLFAVFRFLSAGVGMIVIGSMIFAGVQYSTSRGNPQATQAAIKRITNTVIALFIYMMIFALANYLVPGGMFV